MQAQITDAATLAKCKELLDAWSATRTYTPTRQLGSDSELLKAVSHTVERFTLTTGMRTRFAERRRLPSTSTYYKNPDSIKAYDLWDDVEPNNKRVDAEFALERTRGAVECPVCHGEKEVVCPSCDGKGGHQCKRQHFPREGNFIKCTKYGCYNGNIHSTANQPHPRGYTQCPKCKGSGYIECPDCHGSMWVTCEKCGGDKKVVCEKCEGTGVLVYQWFVTQKYKEVSSVRRWKPDDGLTDDFCAFDKLDWNTLWDQEVEDGRFSGNYPASTVSESVLTEMMSISLKSAWESRIAEVDDIIAAFKKENDKASYRTSFEHAVFEQCDGIVEYDYKYKDKEYKVWINLITGGVEETENGLYGSMAEETSRNAIDAEKKGVPQDAIYYYCKADAISLKWGIENDTQKKRIRQYRILGAIFGGSLLLSALVLWIPLLCQSGMNGLGIGTVCASLALMTVCMVSLNELIQIIGLSSAFLVAYAARQWFGDDIAQDLVAREGLLCGLLLYGLVVVNLTTDFAQRLPWGRKGLVGGGLLAGLVAGLPVALWAGVRTQSFVATGASLVAIVVMLVLSIVKLPTRLRAGKIQKFVKKNDGKCEKIRKVIEGRRPDQTGLILFAAVVVVFVGVSLGLHLMADTLDSWFGEWHFSLLKTLISWGVL